MSKLPRAASSGRRPTVVRLEPEVRRAVMLRTAATGESLSDQVNEALRLKLREDEADLRVFHKRKREPSRPYEEFIADLKKRGRL